MRLYQLEDFKEIYENSEIVAVMNEAIFNASIGKIRNTAQTIYSKQQGIFFTIVEDDKIIGIVGLKRATGTSVEIIHFAILKEYRNKGLGKESMKEIKAHFDTSAVIVEVEHDTVDFFKKCNFKVTVLPRKGLDYDIYRCVLR